MEALAPDSEAPESHFVPEHRVDAEAAAQEEASDGADQALPEEPEVSQEKKKMKRERQ